MQRAKFAAALVAAALLWAAPGVHAADCAGFTDVDSANPFCPNVEWLRNRSITLGCTSATLFCPDQPVTRLAMAALLNRLGQSLAPTYLTSLAGSGGPVDLSAPVRVCETPEYAVGDFPRRAVADGFVNVDQSTTAQGVTVVLGYSVDGGQTYVGAASSWVFATNSPPNFEATAPVIGFPFTLPTATSFRFALIAYSYTGTPGSARIECVLRVRIDNRNGNAPPYEGAEARGKSAAPLFAPIVAPAPRAH